MTVSLKVFSGVSTRSYTETGRTLRLPHISYNNIPTFYDAHVLLYVVLLT